ncbi:MAG: hypothetical protein EXS50_02695 [Candidatus Taylorbacteria bacterium]|nr:hypothetical protein [Candidatus Taylorbacteria bacterium]
MSKKIISKIRIIISLHLVLGMLIFTSGVQVAYAASITSASDTLSTSKVSTLANHDIQFTSPTGVASGQTILITFPSDFSIAGSMDFTDIDVLDDGSNVTLAASQSGATWGAVRTSATVITLTNGTTVVSAGSVMRIKIGTNATNQSTGVRRITNTTTNGSKVIVVSGGTFADSGNITVNILTDDQVAVTATVDQSLTFSISDNTIGFGTLSSSAACWAQGTANCSASEVEAHNLIVGTNAGNGYNVTLDGNTLTSGSFTIATTSANTASSVGSEQFGLRMTATGGSGAVSAPYAASGYAFDSLNFPDQVAAATGSTANTTYSARYIANIGSQTEAGSYTATLTYAATANF